MSRDLGVHMFSNFDIAPTDGEGPPPPLRVFKDSGLNSRRRLIFRSHQRPSFEPSLGDRYQKRAHVAIVVGLTDGFYNSSGTAAATIDYQIEYVNKYIGSIRSFLAPNNYFDGDPFRFGFLYNTNSGFPLYPAGTTKTYDFITVTNVSTSPGTVAQYTTLIGDVIDGDDPEIIWPASDANTPQDVLDYITTTYRESVAIPGKAHVAIKLATSGNAVPLLLGDDTPAIFAQQLMSMSMAYGAPLYVTFTTSVFTPFPTPDPINNYSYDLDTPAT